MLKKYIRNILISLDQLVNTIFGGDPDETISSRLGKNYKDSWMQKLVDKYFGSDHCVNAEEKDEGKDAIIASIKKDNIV